jgi:hypothetical protein
MDCNLQKEVFDSLCVCVPESLDLFCEQESLSPTKLDTIHFYAFSNKMDIHFPKGQTTIGTSHYAYHWGVPKPIPSDYGMLQD